jgi:hypothetical protein
MLLLGIPGVGEPPLTSGLEWATYLAGTIIVLSGTVYCYRCNGGPNGTRFLERYFSVCWVVLVRFLPLGVLYAVLVTSVPGIALVVGLSHFLGLKGDDPVALLYTAFIAGAFGLLVACYWRVGVHIREVAQVGLEAG